ncbi:2-oxoacid:acceptor oxidoreductase family protein [candidate division CSSED10-310 bacterium]|uniref:2-oxoacid:acceptor oxidoreductase family protein n=1 Tax=candidate division CSSED10-310 bacterium TaxID=2855610 RepID=A0ABV6YYN4_UNCC1
MKNFNIYITGVGGQGIGLLAEAIIRAADHAGHTVRGVDTHGLAQRGGVVVSYVRLGSSSHSPLFPAGEADLVIALERHEALRGLASFLKKQGTIIYYDALWQPLDVRLKKAQEVTPEQIITACEKKQVKLFTVQKDDLEDVRMQNVVVLSKIAQQKLIPDVMPEHYQLALADLLTGQTLEKNISLFNYLL